MALFGFLGGKKTSVGLDIGSGIIKVAVIDHSGSEAELVKVATTEVAADAILEGEVMDPGIVAEAIRGLFAAAGVKQKSVVTAVGGRDVIVKKIQMDRMKEQDAREVIRWEAEQHVPFDMANVELDFQILDPEAEGLQMSVLLVAAKRELVEGRTGLLNEAGLEPAIIDVDAFAIHNAFELNHPDAMRGERAAAFLATASRSAGGLSRVYTIGGGARIPGLNEALGSRLRVGVEVANPVQRLKVRDAVFDSVPVDEVAPLLMLSVGLA